MTNKDDEKKTDEQKPDEKKLKSKESTGITNWCLGLVLAFVPLAFLWVLSLFKLTIFNWDYLMPDVCLVVLSVAFNFLLLCYECSGGERTSKNVISVMITVDFIFALAFACIYSASKTLLVIKEEVETIENLLLVEWPSASHDDIIGLYIFSAGTIVFFFVAGLIFHLRQRKSSDEKKTEEKVCA